MSLFVIFISEVITVRLKKNMDRHNLIFPRPEILSVRISSPTGITKGDWKLAFTFSSLYTFILIFMILLMGLFV